VLICCVQDVHCLARTYFLVLLIHRVRKKKHANYVIACKLRRKSSCLDVILRVLRRLELAAGVGAYDDAHTVRTVIKNADE
jgi:hypothetical protein